MKNNLLKRIGLWAVTITVLITSVGASSAFAAYQAKVDVGDAESLIQAAGRAQLVAQKFARCIPNRQGLGDMNRTFYADDVENGNWFDSSIIPTNIAVGAWLENQTQGKIQDGEIYCRQGILEKFMSTFGLTITQVACNKYSDSGNGHLSGGVFRQNANDVECENFASGNAYKKVEDDAAIAYIGQLYTEAMKDNPYAKAWGDIGTYDSATGYFLYKQDFETVCADKSKYMDNNSNAKTFASKVKIVNNKAEIVEKYATPINNKTDNASSGTSFAASGPTTCGGLIDKINQYATDYQNALKDAIRKECGSDEVKAKVAEFIAEYEAKEGELTDEEKEDYQKLVDARDSGDYTQATSGGGLECAEFKNLTIDPTPTPGPGGGGDGDADPVDDTHVEEEACFQNAGPLGWIICPIIFGLRSAVTETYEAIEPFIMVDNSIVSELASGTDSYSGSIYPSWNTFRSIANILFVIFFLFVIFSQLTGFGIDNYGIKKMLPKLIISAILVNLSFIICAVAVDISNIIGKSINDMLVNMAPAVTSLSGGSGGHMGAYVASIVTAVVGVVAAGVLAGWTIIIPILLFLLTMIISIIFALIVLGLRQAIVIALIVISPLAIVFYTLPNTQKIFDKWVSISKNILMVYPICGALIGGGYFASHILLNAYGGADSNTVMGHFMTILAGLLCVVPYFFIPSLTRKAVDGIGNLGSRITNLGNRAGAGASNRINNSNAVRNARQNAQAAAANRRAWASQPLDNLTMKASKAAAGAKTRRGKALGWLANHTIASNGRLEAVKRNAETRIANSNETARMNAQGARNNLDRMLNGGYAAREAGLEDKAFEGAVTDQTSLYQSNGVFSNIGDMKETTQDISAQDGTFVKEVYDAAVNGNDAKLEALMRQAAKGTDKHREALRKGMDKALSSGQVSEQTAKRYASHVQTNGIYKSQARSMNDQADAIMNAANSGSYSAASAGSFASTNYAGQAAVKGKQSGAMAFNFDDAEFDALAAKASMSTTTAEEKQAIANLMSGALNVKANDTTGQYDNVKQETIDRINGVLGATGLQRDPQAGLNDSLKIDHSGDGGGAPTPISISNPEAYKNEIIRRVTAGELSSEHGDQLIDISRNQDSAQARYIKMIEKRVADKQMTQVEADNYIRNMLNRGSGPNPNPNPPNNA